MRNRQQTHEALRGIDLMDGHGGGGRRERAGFHPFSKAGRRTMAEWLKGGVGSRPRGRIHCSISDIGRIPFVWISMGTHWDIMPACHLAACLVLGVQDSKGSCNASSTHKALLTFHLRVGG